MEQFLINNYSLLTYIFILIAVVAGIISYKKYKATPAVFFIKIIFFLFFVELIGSYSYYYENFEFLKPISNSIFKANYWWFTFFFDIVVVVLISVFYQKIIKTNYFKSILMYSTLAFLCFGIIYIIVNNTLFFNQMLPILSVIGGIVILLSCVFYLIELLQSEQILIFYKSVYFYITIGVFIWWLVVTPLTFYDVYMVNSDWDFIILKWQVLLSLNFIMYIIFSIGLLVSKPENK